MSDEPSSEQREELLRLALQLACEELLNGTEPNSKSTEQFQMNLAIRMSQFIAEASAKLNFLDSLKKKSERS